MEGKRKSRQEWRKAVRSRDKTAGKVARRGHAERSGERSWTASREGGRSGGAAEPAVWAGVPEGRGQGSLTAGEGASPGTAELHGVQERLRRGRVLDLTEDEDDVDPIQEGYDEESEEEEDEEEEEAGRARLQCYSCQALLRREDCSLVQNCSSRHTFCKTILSHSETEAGALTTYSAWCTDTCQPVTRTVDRTMMTINCCQSNLCNTPPWQQPPSSKAGWPQGKGTVFQDQEVGVPPDRGQGLSPHGDAGRTWSKGRESSQDAEPKEGRGRESGGPWAGKAGGARGRGAWSAQGSLLTVAIAFESSLLFGLWFLES